MITQWIDKKKNNTTSESFVVPVLFYYGVSAIGYLVISHVLGF